MFPELTQGVPDVVLLTGEDGRHFEDLSGLPFGEGLGLESLATAYDYDNFAGNNGPTPSFETASGHVFLRNELNLLV